VDIRTVGSIEDLLETAIPSGVFPYDSQRWQFPNCNKKESQKKVKVKVKVKAKKATKVKDKGQG
jgi:hypothetical protein